MTARDNPFCTDVPRGVRLFVYLIAPFFYLFPYSYLSIIPFITHHSSLITHHLGLIL